MAFLRQAPPNTTVPQTTQQFCDEIPNNAGGFAYEVDTWTRLERFLTIGSQGGTFYVDQEFLTDENTRDVQECLAQDPVATVRRAVDVSTAGRTVKQDYALYVVALALASDDLYARVAGYAAIQRVCRTASTLFQLLSYLKGRRGWSRGLRSAVGRWYATMPVEKLAYQMVKYQNRHGFTHRDALRLSHPTIDASVDSEATGREALYAWAVGKVEANDARLPHVIADFEAAKTAEYRTDLARRLPREALPTHWLSDPDVWEALLYGSEGKGMPLAALIRNLGNLSKCGLLAPGSAAAGYVVQALTDRDQLNASRVHPIALFLAQKQYAAGQGLLGRGTWTPVGGVIDALSVAFPMAFGNVAPTGKRLHVAIDVSGSMRSAALGIPNCHASEIATAMALVHANVEAPGDVAYSIFDTTWRKLVVAKDDTVERLGHRLGFGGGGTDLTQAIAAASADREQRDAIVIYTDSETWAGRGHLGPVFDAYRVRRNRAAKLVVCSTTANRLGAADPKRADVLQVAGFDTAVPNVLADFLSR